MQVSWVEGEPRLDFMTLAVYGAAGITLLSLTTKLKYIKTPVLDTPIREIRELEINVGK